MRGYLSSGCWLERATGFRVYLALALGFILLALWGAGTLRRHGRRLLQQTASKLRESDDRSPLLFLRMIRLALVVHELDSTSGSSIPAGTPTLLRSFFSIIRARMVHSWPWAIQMTHPLRSVPLDRMWTMRIGKAP